LETTSSTLNPVRVAKEIFSDDENITLLESAPIVLVHLVCLAAPFVGVSKTALWVCLATYLVRVFALTAGFHRYFSHRAFATSRVFQFILAFVGTSAAQLSPIWWASHHRHHHEYSDTPEDIHSPGLKGFWWAHIGWIMCPKYAPAQAERVGDLLRCPELRFLDKFHVVAPLSLGVSLYALGAYLGTHYPGLHTSGWQLVVWGFFISTVLVYHVTFCINSVTHMFGKRRFETRDHSRNSLLLALVTMGEGWHNNHHRYPVSVRQGMYWWEIDMTYYLLRVLEKIGLIWNLQKYPDAIYAEAEKVKRAAKNVQG
jgi:stearoyl-CoA desaturase (delta-9 desaturase)